MSNLVIPAARPNLTREAVEAHLSAQTKIDFDKYPLYWVGIRGYYKKSIGDPERNDYGVYDDAAFLFGENHFSAYNANTDPAKVLRGSASKKGTAVLVPDLYFVHMLDLHKGSYPALCQRAGNVSVWRYKADGTRWKDTGSFGINGHCGGRSSTNSEGCQTIVPIQYAEWIGNVFDHIGSRGWNGVVVPYLLIEY